MARCSMNSRLKFKGQSSLFTCPCRVESHDCSANDVCPIRWSWTTRAQKLCEQFLFTVYIASWVGFCEMRMRPSYCSTFSCLVCAFVSGFLDGMNRVIMALETAVMRFLLRQAFDQGFFSAMPRNICMQKFSTLAQQGTLFLASCCSGITRAVPTDSRVSVVKSQRWQEGTDMAA